MIDIRFKCEECGKRVVIDRQARGLYINCPQCSYRQQVPAEQHDGAHMCVDGQRITLPRYLEEQIFGCLGGKYKQLMRGAELWVDSNEADLRIYLGTFFPRSFVESWNIAHDLGCLRPVRVRLESLDRIRILDIGSGTGGNLLGLLESLRWHDMLDRQIEVVSVDGNQAALDIQQSLVDGFVSRWNVEGLSLRTICHRLSCDGDECSAGLQQLTSEVDGDFNFVMTWKHLKEFYNSDYNAAKGISGVYARWCAEMVASSAVVVFLDMTHTIGEKGPYFPFVLNKELNETLCADHHGLTTILPASCARWAQDCVKPCFSQRVYRVAHRKKANDVSKVTYRIMAPPELAREVVAEYGDAEEYVVSRARGPEACRCGTIVKGGDDMPCAYDVRRL